MANLTCVPAEHTLFTNDKTLTLANGYIGVIGSRNLPIIYKPKVKEAVRQLLEKGYDIASGGAVGADNFALESLLELGACRRGIIFSAWRCLDQFPIPVRENIRKFITEGGQVVWGDVPGYAERNTVVAGLLSRNIRLVSGAVGLVAFPFGDSRPSTMLGTRGTAFTVRNTQKKAIPCLSGRQAVKIFLSN